MTLENGIAGIPPSGIGDWLEKRFGGVVGWIHCRDIYGEFHIAIHVKSKLLNQYSNY
jgi:hypothetical protein